VRDGSLRLRRQPTDPGRRGASLAAWHPAPKGIETMLWTIVVILLVLWLLGLVSSYTLGGFIHILLVIAIIIVIVNLVRGRRPL
jgi:hypothetical protein